MAIIILISLVSLALLALLAILSAQNKILKEFKNIRIPEPQKIEFPKIEFPKMEIPPVEIPPAKEYTLDLNPVIEAIKNIQIPAPQKIEFPAIPQKEGSGIDAEAFQEIASLMRVNQAEFQSGLEAFHKAIDKMLAQVPNGEKELDVQKEFMRKFEDAFAQIQEKSAEAMRENSLRLQEILAEFLNRENNK